MLACAADVVLSAAAGGVVACVWDVDAAVVTGDGEPAPCCAGGEAVAWAGIGAVWAIAATLNANRPRAVAVSQTARGVRRQRVRDAGSDRVRTGVFGVSDRSVVFKASPPRRVVIMPLQQFRAPHGCLVITVMPYFSNPTRWRARGRTPMLDGDFAHMRVRGCRLHGRPQHRFDDRICR
ncbi:hypothetical protein Tasa_031_070 [Tanticharoenia sakaeratensis NBRC 103193]|uniref:Uncharacterized protein n=1 Tax=Tanticharoenia sakaeratensis NBRC 103193 TaxID=1231623 RepID=A0A0D6MMF9_9PROT|nr:hypothetical protein Tasa_031_070 [Tanticharoenia sakaeratensis NBRC 103193]GBQ21368.1 hypothetical protein AA103193_1703 [Tanticharoenia sakaeratensis NBRC 103193]